MKTIVLPTPKGERVRLRWQSTFAPVWPCITASACSALTSTRRESRYLFRSRPASVVAYVIPTADR